MGRRGRPPYPDILTPREWEVLALLRENLTNEAIAVRLGVTHAAAKYHVSEILSKLGVASREEAAAWEPAGEAAEAGKPRLRRWWGAGLGWLRPVTVGKAALMGAGVAVLVGLVVLAWGVLRTDVLDGSGQLPLAGWTSCPTLVASELPPGLHAMDAATCALTEMASGDDIAEMTWSPDGSAVAFLRYADSAITPFSGTADIYVAAADGSNVRQLTDSPDILEGQPAWSPDGMRIAYSILALDQITHSETTGLNEEEWMYELKVADLATGATTVIVRDQSCLGGYGWAPDGERIYVASGCDGVDNPVQIFDLQTGDAISVPGAARVLGWQPSGGLIAYGCRIPSPPEGLDNWGICIGGADASGELQAVNSSRFPGFADERPIEYAITALSALWTTDGGTLVVDGYGVLYLLPADGSPGEVIEGLAHDSIHWASEEVLVMARCKQPEGQSVLPCLQYELVSYRVSSGETSVTMLFNCGAGGAVWSPDGRKLAIIAPATGSCGL